MKLRKLIFTFITILMVINAYAQRNNRGYICKEIPGLTPEQHQEIDKLSITHQKTMDGLRAQFYAERDGVKASGFKTQMDTEMKNHNQNISNLLTTEQHIWFDQNCNVNNRRGNYYRGGFGRNGKDCGRGQRRGQGRRTY